MNQNINDSERWWNEGEDNKEFGEWFDTEYGNDYEVMCVGIVASALSHVSLTPFGSDASYITKKLRSIISEVESQAERMVVDRIRSSMIWKLVPNTPRMIMCSDKELDELLKSSLNISNNAS